MTENLTFDSGKLDIQMHLQILLLLLSTSSSYAALGGHVGSVQSAAVEGNLTCNGKPAANVLIKLYDVDRGFFQNCFDDLGSIRHSVENPLKVANRSLICSTEKS